MARFRCLSPDWFTIRASEIDSYSRVPERVNSPGISGLADIGFVKEMSIPENKPDIQFVIAKSKSRSEKTEKKYKWIPKSSIFLNEKIYTVAKFSKFSPAALSLM